MDYSEDFYQGYGEFDKEIDNFKQSLVKSIRQEFLDEMDSLRKENGELQEIKDNWESLKQSYSIKEHDLMLAKENARSEARSAKLADLLESHKFVMYKVTTEYIKRPKCSHCDDKYQIHFTTPEGRDVSTSCDCAHSDTKYIPGEFVAYEFKLDGYRHELYVWYKQIIDNQDEYFKFDTSSDYGGLKNVYKGEEYDTLKYYETFFKDRNDCQKYCDWLNKNEN
jgi:hypothetical protein